MDTMTEFYTHPDYPYYAIVAEVCRARRGEIKSYYRSLAAAQRDAFALAQDGYNVGIRVVGCTSRKQAIEADISDGLPTVSHP